MLVWIIKNKEWIFSGIGVALIIGIFTTMIKFLFFNKKDKDSLNVENKNIEIGKNNIMHSGMGNINKTININNASKQPQYRVEHSNGKKIVYKYDPDTETETIESITLE